MEENNKCGSDISASFSWWADSHNRLHQSPWLQSALSELDEKTKLVISLIQGDGDSFAKRAEMFYIRRAELIKLVQDLHESYRSLAQRYDQVRSECIRLAHLRSLSSSLNSDNKRSLHSDEEIQESDHKTSYSIDHQSLYRLANESISTEHRDSDVILKTTTTMRPDSGIGLEKIMDGIKSSGDYLSGDHDEREKVWNEMNLKVSTLMEENLREQNELIKRNEEKREVIRQLRSHINRLMEENRALKSRLLSCNGDVTQTQSCGCGSAKLKGSPLQCIGKCMS